MTKTAPEQLEDAARDVSIDGYLKRDPATISREEVADVVVRLRGQRAQFIKNDEKKKAKKEGVEE